ncbi:MAG TPA: VWA domain-containing protein [Candidatus Angelobacter sp.]|jgi:VWFA-related protein
MNTSIRLHMSVLLIALVVAIGFAQTTSDKRSGDTAQSSATTPDQSQAGTASVLKVKTRLVVVDVVAVDHKGSPVADLKSEDFTLLEDGHEQKIRVFTFQHPIEPAAGQPVMVEASLSPNRITNMPRFKTNSALNVLLLDGINVTNVNQKYTREQMLKYLEKLPAGQPVAVYALGSKLRMLQDFTADPTQLREAVKKAKDNSLGIRADVSNAMDLPPGLLEQMPTDMYQTILRFGEEQASNQMDERVRLTLSELSALAGNLAGFPGRKNLIWLSEAFPDYLYPLNPELQNSRDKYQRSFMRDYQAQIEHTADMLANAQVAVYPVDSGTLINRDSYSSLSNTDSNGINLGRSARAGSSRGGVGSQQATEIGRSTDVTVNSHATMNTVAEQTGGKAFYNTNNIERAIRDSIEDGSTYYTLGYYPENKDWDGKFRKIAVKVNRSGTKLHYRQGFFAAEPMTYARQDAKILGIDIGNALDLNNPLATALPFQAVVIPPSASNGKVQINYGVDPKAISFQLSSDGLQHAAVDCGVSVYTLKGESVRVQGNTFNAALTPEQFQKVMQMIFPCNQTLDLPAGDYALRLAVRDLTTGLIGTANGRVTVPATAAKEETAPSEVKKP